MSARCRSRSAFACGAFGERILEEYPALHQFNDAVSPRIEGLLRTPFPAQTIAIMGVAKRWQQARTAMVVAECGTGKPLISLGAIHVHCGGSRFTALAMVPPHLVEKWAREAFLTLPGTRLFLNDDLRNGGDENQAHGVNEVRMRQGRIVREGFRTRGCLVLPLPVFGRLLDAPHIAWLIQHQSQEPKLFVLPHRDAIHHARTHASASRKSL